MKPLLFILCLIITIVGYSQTLTTTQYQLSFTQDVGILSSQKDTLYLLNQDIGYMIKKVWDQFPKPNPPKIIFIEEKILNYKIFSQKTKILTSK